MKRLPIGIQSFKNLRSQDYLYVDKTREIYRMITSGKMFFLSYPRRFGKSLLLSTLEEIFKGNKDLFQDLYVYDKIDRTKQSPVICIDFGSMSYRTTQALSDSLHLLLNTYFDQYNIERIEAPLDTKFQAMIAKLHQATGEKVVVLIDEYDKPIIDNLNQPELADEIRIFLHDFYQVLKGSDEHLCFVFLTGVSKFAKVSVFSGLNNLRDITLSYDYATICGYTQEELEFYFD